MDADAALCALVTMVGTLAGWFSRGYTLSKKERFDVQMAKAERSIRYKTERERRGELFKKRISKLIELKRDPNLSREQIWGLYFDVRGAGDQYFESVNDTCSAILRNEIDPLSATQDQYDDIRRIAFDVLPAFYEVTQEIAARFSIEHSDRIQHTTYRNIRLYLKGQLNADDYADLLRRWGITDPLDA